MLSQLRAGLNGNSALLDDQPIPCRSLGDRTSDPFDGRQVGVAIRQRRGSHANEDRVSEDNRIFGGTEAQAATFTNRLDNVLEMRLKKWHHTVLQFGEFFSVTFTAEHVVTDLRQASRRRQTDITRTNNGELHLELFLILNLKKLA